MFGLGIGLELIGFVSRRILQAGAFPEQLYGDRADPASSDVKPHGGNHLSEGHRGNNRHAAGVADRREARTAANLTQAQLADRLKTDQGNVARLERGRTQVTIRTLKRIAEATGHSLIVDFQPLKKQPPVIFTENRIIRPVAVGAI
jgi:DNA-binding XRE family transcriptional regulator